MEVSEQVTGEGCLVVPSVGHHLVRGLEGTWLAAGEVPRGKRSQMAWVHQQD